MTESVAMAQYLVEKYGPSDLRVMPDEPDYPAYLNWLHHADATLTFPQTVVLRYKFQEPGVADAAIEGYSCLLYTSPSPRDVEESRMPSSA